MCGPPTDLETASKPENGTRIRLGSTPKTALLRIGDIDVIKAFLSETHTEKAH